LVLASARALGPVLDAVSDTHTVSRDEGLIVVAVRITTTIIAPSFLTAALFKIVGDIIILLGPKYSRLKPVTCK